MRDFDYLREMRRRGFAPMKVYIDLDFQILYGKGVPFNPELPHLYLDETKNVRTMDLRCLAGLDVQVNGFNKIRLAVVAEAIAKVEPSRLITVRHHDIGIGEWRHFPIVEVTDTKGVVTWLAD